MTNAWKTLCNDNMLSILSLLGCDRKYIDGSASDFECFREWCAACSRLFCNAVAEDFVGELSAVIGKRISVADVALADASELWKECNAKLNANRCYDTENVEKYKSNDKYITSFLCDEKTNSLNEVVSLNVLLNNGHPDFDALCKSLANIDKKAFLVTLENDEFCRPSKYHAEQEYIKHINGEKCNLDLIITQILCEVFYLKNGEKIQLIIDVNRDIAHVKALIRYLSLRKLNVRVFLLLSADITAERIAEVCGEGDNNVFVTPCLLKDSSADLLDSLSKIYPCGAVSIIDHMEK